MARETCVYRTYTFLHSEDTYSLLYASMPKERQQKADSFRFERDKKLCIAAWGLLLIALEDAGIDRKGLRFVANRYGKPVLINRDVYFNLSHSGDCIMCVLSKEFEVGCDVERVGSYEADLARVCLRSSEIAKIEVALDVKQKAWAFFRHWTLKESYLKARGVGLNVSLNSFEIVTLQDGIYAEFESGVDKGYVLQELKLNDRYSYAVCVMSCEAELIFPRGRGPIEL